MGSGNQPAFGRSRAPCPPHAAPHAAGCSGAGSPTASPRCPAARGPSHPADGRKRGAAPASLIRAGMNERETVERRQRAPAGEDSDERFPSPEPRAPGAVTTSAPGKGPEQPRRTAQPAPSPPRAPQPGGQREGTMGQPPRKADGERGDPRARPSSPPGRDTAPRRSRAPSRPRGEGGRRDGAGEAGLRAPFCSVPSPPQPSSPRSGPTPRPGYRCRSCRVLLRAGARLAARALRRHLPAVTAPARSAARSRVAAAAARRLTPSPPAPGPPAARSLTPPAPSQRRAAGWGERVPAMGYRAVGFHLLPSAPSHQAARSQAEAGERDPTAGRPPAMVAEGSAPGTARPAGTARLPARLRGSEEWRERIEEKKERACAVLARLTCPVRSSRSLGRKGVSLCLGVLTGVCQKEHLSCHLPVEDQGGLCCSCSLFTDMFTCQSGFWPVRVHFRAGLPQGARLKPPHAALKLTLDCGCPLPFQTTTSSLKTYFNLSKWNHYHTGSLPLREKAMPPAWRHYLSAFLLQWEPTW